MTDLHHICAALRRERDLLRESIDYLVEQNATLWSRLQAARDESDPVLRQQRDQLLRLVVDSRDSPAEV